MHRDRLFVLPALPRIIPAMAGLFLAASVTASAVTPEELASLRRAGLGDAVLSALVETTGVQGRIDAADALALRQAGVSDAVIAEAIRRGAGNTMPADPASLFVPEAAVDVPPDVAVIGDRAEPPPVPLVEPTLVIAVPVLVRRAHPGCRTCQAAPVRTTEIGRFINTDLRPLNDGAGRAVRHDAPAAPAGGR
jgi:hypothetical protein